MTSTCNIIWDSLSPRQWCTYLMDVQPLPLLQTPCYAKSVRQVHQQTSRFGLIQIDGEDAGLCTLQEVSLFKNLIHHISLDRGPLWFTDKSFGNAHHKRAFLEHYHSIFPKRFGRKRRIIPEMLDNPAHQTMLQETGWTKNKKTPHYRTIWLDLQDDLDHLRKNLHQKWRNALNKSEKRNLILDYDQSLDSLDIFLRRYMQDRLSKSYAGASPKMLKALCQNVQKNDMGTYSESHLLLNALTGDDIAASILIFTHGHSATYQAGWSGPLGRDNNAHYFLLWQAIEIMKKRNIKFFDLGGLTYSESASGLNRFKMGLGGEEVTLSGQFS